MSEASSLRFKPSAIGVAVALLVVGVVAFTAVRTRPVRQVVTAYTELLGAINRQDLDAVRRLCSRRYLRTHVIASATEGGVVGMPRNIHKNFQAWRQGSAVWLCPTNRVGPVYQFVYEDPSWRFDGPVGLLRGQGKLIPMSDLPSLEPDRPRKE